MLAITVDDILVLPRVTESDPAAVDRKVLGVSTAPSRRDFNELVYVLAGSGSVGADQRPVRMGQLAVYGVGDVVTVAADEQQDSRRAQLEMLVLGGEPIREPAATSGPFVTNTREELDQALVDYQAGRPGSIPAEPHPRHDVL